MKRESDSGDGSSLLLELRVFNWVVNELIVLYLVLDHSVVHSSLWYCPPFHFIGREGKVLKDTLKDISL